MRKTVIFLMSAALLTSTALTGSAIARDRSDRAELTANQMTDRAEARSTGTLPNLSMRAGPNQRPPVTASEFGSQSFYVLPARLVFLRLGYFLNPRCCGP